MKRKVLRPWAEKTLTAMTIMLGLICGSINDFNFEAIPIVAGLWALFFTTAGILSTWGR